ncbi:MAG TPA: hypothetical protein VN759_12280, partial [Pseudolysinimonas sp.]|nr:hypothetical protein [Pseudolysinimonas sp.]
MTTDTPGLQLSRMSPARRDLLAGLAAEILANYARGWRMIAVDGPSGAGKTTFADDLAVALRADGATVFRASVDDFHRPRAERYQRGRFSAEGYYRDAFDYST